MATELAKAYVQIVPSAQGIQGSISSVMNGEGTSAGESTGKNFASSFGSMAKKAMVGLGIGKIVKDAIGDASEFETAMAKTSTLFTGTGEEFDALQAKILDLSSSYGLAATTLAEAAYSAESASVPMDQLGAMLESSAKLAQAGFTDIDTALSATAKTMNAYGDVAMSMDDIQKVLIQTQNLGITTVGELGQSLANVTPTAAAMGVGFDQVGAAMAQLTASGVQTAQATTQLRSAMTELGKSGTKADKAFREATKGTKYAGMGFKEAMAAGANLGDVFGMMQKYADKSGQSMVDLWGSVEAGNAAMLIASDVDKFNSNLKQMATNSDVVGEAYDKMSNTFGNSMNRLKESAKNFMTTLFQGGDISASFDNLLNSLGDVGGKLISWLTTGLKTLGENLPDMMESLLHFGEGLLDSLGDVDWISLGTTIIEGIIGALGTLGAHLVELVGSAISSVANGEVDFSQIGSAILSGVQSILTTGGDWLKTLFEAGKTAVETINFGDIGTKIKEAIEGILGAAGSFLETIFTSGKEAVATAAEQDWPSVGEVIKTAVNLALNGGKFLSELFDGGRKMAQAINWAALGGKISNLVEIGLEGIKNVMTEIFTAAVGLIQAIDWTTLGNSISDLVVSGIEGVQGLMVAVFDGATKMVKAINWASLGGSISNLVVDGLNGVKDLMNGVFDAAYGLIKGIHWSDLGGSISQTLISGLEGVKSLMVDVFNGAGNMIKAINWASLGANISNTMEVGLKGAGTILEDAFTAAHSFIMGIDWAEAGSAIQSGLGDVWSGITGLIGGTLSGAGNAIEGGLSFAGKGVNWLGKLIFGDDQEDMKQAAEELKTAINEMNTALSEGQKTLKETARGIGSNILTGITEQLAPATLLTKGQAVVTAIANGMGMEVETLTNKVGELCDGAKTKFDSYDETWKTIGRKNIVENVEAGIAEKMSVFTNACGVLMDMGIKEMKGKDWLSVGTNIVDGIISGINAASSRLTASLTALAKKALAAARTALGIKSPSTVMRDDVGRWIPEGIALGIEDNESIVEDAMNELAANTAAASINGALAAQGRGFGSIADNGAFGSAEGGLFSRIVEAIREGMESADIDLYMDGQKVSERINEYLGSEMAARRFA